MHQSGRTRDSRLFEVGDDAIVDDRDVLRKGRQSFNDHARVRVAQLEHALQQQATHPSSKRR